MVINVGLVGPKARPKGVTDGHQVNIPELRANRSRLHIDSLMGLCLHHPVLVKWRIESYILNPPFSISQFVQARSGADMSAGKDMCNLGAA